MGIGPSIGPCCFEVDSPVANEFIEAWPEHKNEIVQPGEDGKFTVNLWEANRIQLEQLGVKKPYYNSGTLHCLQHGCVFQP